MEKYNVIATDLTAGGGEYPAQDGFGWTNGVYLALDNWLSAPVFYSIAANNGYRTQLYSFLKTINKAVLFPKEFLTPQKFAEAYVYNYAVEETDSLSLEAKGDRTIKVNGKLQRYFLFKVNTVYDGDAFSYLGICGPFENKKNTEINEDAVRVEVFYDEEYNPASIEKFFQQFINPEPEKAGE
jgi:hypothetical protein